VSFALLSILETTAIDLSASYSSEGTSSIEHAGLVHDVITMNIIKSKKFRGAQSAQFLLFCFGLTTLNLLPPPL
jgi:hypothetical protein